MKYSEYTQKKAEVDRRLADVAKRQTEVLDKMRNGTIHEPYDVYIENFSVDYDKAFLRYQDLAYVIELFSTLKAHGEEILQSTIGSNILGLEKEAEDFIIQTNLSLEDAKESKERMNAKLIQMKRNLEIIKDLERDNLVEVFYYGKKFIEAQSFFAVEDARVDVLISESHTVSDYSRLITKARELSGDEPDEE